MYAKECLGQLCDTPHGFVLFSERPIVLCNSTSIPGSTTIILHLKSILMTYNRNVTEEHLEDFLVNAIFMEKGVNTGLVEQTWGFPLFDPM